MSLPSRAAPEIYRLLVDLDMAGAFALQNQLSTNTSLTSQVEQ